MNIASLSRTTLTAALVAATLNIVGCGDDDDNGGTPDARVFDAPTGSSFDGPVTAGCPTHPNVTQMSAGVCQLTGGQTSPVTQNLTLTEGNEYVLNGPLWIGNDTAETVLTIEPGVTVFGGSGAFILIQRGSKIMADGTAAKPIILTSAKSPGSRASEDWGGLVINGRAPINNGNASGEAPGEVGTGTYGGNNANDNSGVLRYVRVEFAGNRVDDENELNGIAFQGVGAGTTVDFVQTHMTSDDGIEMFGGTVNLKHLVITGADDDSLDWTGGWSGKAQFVVANQFPESGAMAERGIEADNLEANNSATPFSTPTIANVTLIARSGNNAQGMELRRGTKGTLRNFIVTGFGGPCVRVSDPQTASNVADGSLSVNNMVFNCTGAIPAGATTDLVTGHSTTGDPMLNASWIPAAGSPALGIGSHGLSDSFFTAATYAGAFDGSNNWAAGWIETARN